MTSDTSRAVNPPELPSGKHTKKNWKITICMRKNRYLDWAMFNSYVQLPEGNHCYSIYAMNTKVISTINHGILLLISQLFGT